MALLEEDSIIASRNYAITLFTGTLRDALENIPEDIMCLAEPELEKHFRMSEKYYFMRRNLWKKVDECRRLGTASVEHKDIYDGVSAYQNFYQQVMPNPYKLAWLFTPLASFQDNFEEILFIAIRKLRNEVINWQMTEKNASAFIRMVEFLSNRALGPVIQKIEQKNLNANFDMGNALPSNPEDIEKQLAEIKSRLHSGKMPALDVGSSEDNDEE